MVIDDLNILCVVVSPGETNPPLIVDSNAVSAGPVALQQFQLVAWGDPKIIQLPRLV